MRKNVTIDEHAENDSIIYHSSIKNVEWSYDNEEMLAEWCDIAQCYRWLYSRTHSYYSHLHAWFTIPSIICSTVSGTASFAQTSLPIHAQVYAPMVIGTINIIIGILATIQQYLKISELKESHRIASIGWDKFSRNISIELSKTPDERTMAGSFLKFNRQEFDRLMESNQLIPYHIIEKFNRIFKGKTSEEQHNFDIITKPDVCNSIVSVHERRHMWFATRDDGTIHKNRFRRSSINNLTFPNYFNEKEYSAKSKISSHSKTNELPRRPNFNENQKHQSNEHHRRSNNINLNQKHQSNELPRPNNIHSNENQKHQSNELPRPNNIHFNIHSNDINEKQPDENQKPPSNELPHPNNINNTHSSTANENIPDENHPPPPSNE